MSRDRFEGQASKLSDPAEGLLTVTPSDVADLTVICRALYVGVAGDVAVRAADGTEATFQNVPAGTPIPVRVRRVLQTGTTATAVVGLY